MMKRTTIEIVLLAGLFAVAGARAGDESMNKGATSHADMSPMPGATRDDDAHAGMRFAFGKPGNAEKVDRTIRIRALDTMHYDKPTFVVRAGETVRIIVTNAGKMRHEVIIGDAAEQREHEKEMRGMPAGMVMPDEANGISLAPGETKSIVWQFGGSGTVELACHEPGHFKAGMVSRVVVGK